MSHQEDSLRVTPARTQVCMLKQEIGQHQCEGDWSLPKLGLGGGIPAGLESGFTESRVDFPNLLHFRMVVCWWRII